MINTVANLCHANARRVPEGDLDAGGRHGAAATKGSGSAVNPLVKVSVQSKKGKVAACAANQLAAAVVKKLGTYPAAKIKNLKAHIAFDNAGHRDDPGGDRRTRHLRHGQADPPDVRSTGPARQDHDAQLLLQATQVESPYVLANAASNKITARSRRNTVVIGALIGLILGALAALLWEPVAARVTPRNGKAPDLVSRGVRGQARGGRRPCV